MISHKHLLEWMTSEEAEKQSKTSISGYYKMMFSNIILFYILLASLFIVFVTMIARLRKFKTWINTRTKNRPMEEIGFLLYNKILD